ncbi:Outer membrane protein/peptidoglycan-associated (Lipo)protein [Sterolibacterium denitrificans]|uniref:Outer membrane protein/peptidoglycan-associated (Lipo)protein n=2 Tax=Sterolibacterium denitrificans TaxID=157592 RepID=A0A7Z7HS15_9PROT|nr:Outer membrane protein/peptidoglycan-associated (Lipo)protein [Sterolibacterium denitrificans]
MTKKNSQIMLFAALGLFASTAFAQAPDNDGYMFDTRGVVARSGHDLCWRTTRWTPAMAIEECDPDLVKKPEVAAAVPAPVPAPAPKPVAEKITLAADALFDFDKAVLRPEGKAKLDDLAAKSQQLNVEVILAVGHADRLGRAAYNQSLSERRAEAVKQYLVGKGVDANRIDAAGKGSTQPVTKADECKGTKRTKALIDCLQPDRRVSIEVIGTK